MVETPQKLQLSRKISTSPKQPQVIKSRGGLPVFNNIQASAANQTQNLPVLGKRTRSQSSILASLAGAAAKSESPISVSKRVRADSSVNFEGKNDL